MLQNQRACQLVRSKTGCEPLALAVAWGARTAGRCAAGVLGAGEASALFRPAAGDLCRPRAGICPKPVCDAGEPCPLPPQDDAVDVSVIVPVHNGERFLRACLDSILHQTYQDLEILLVDDGSTDASGAICDEYAAQEERVTAVHQKNGGLSAARNAGLERAQGTYLCFVDSDDFLNSRMLETLCRDLQEQDADVAVVGFRMFEREEELAPAELAVPVQCMTGREAIRSTLVSDELGDFAWNKLYKRELFRDIRYPLGRMMEDQGTTYRIFQQCSKVVYRPVPLYYYYQRPDSILHRRNMKFYEDKLDMGYQKYRAIREAYPGMPENDAAMLSVVEHCYPYLMQDTVRRAKMEAFLQECDPAAAKLLCTSSQRKYQLLRCSRRLYAKLFLLKNGPAAK